MTTTAIPQPKPSFISKLDTDLVAVGKKIKAGLEEAGSDAVKVAAFLANNQSEIVGLASLAGGGAAKASQVGLSLVNLAVNAVKDAGSAAGQNGISITLDQAVIADLKDLINAIEKV